MRLRKCLGLCSQSLMASAYAAEAPHPRDRCACDGLAAVADACVPHASLARPAGGGDPASARWCTEHCPLARYYGGPCLEAAAQCSCPRGAAPLCRACRTEMGGTQLYLVLLRLQQLSQRGVWGTILQLGLAYHGAY